MKKLAGIFLAFCLAISCAEVVKAQDATQPPPKILEITREFLKPGTSSAAHVRTESALVQARTRAKSPAHYLGMDSITGKPRSLFFSGYDSFEAWEKTIAAEQKDTALAAGLDRDNAADGGLLDSTETAAFLYNEEGSYQAGVDIAHMRYFEIEVFRVRSGHKHEFDEGGKLVKAAIAKANPDAHWAMYDAVYGAPAGTVLIITPRKSASEIDTDFANEPKFMAAMGKDGMKRLGEISSAAIESEETNIFAFNPRISYVGPDWIKADPEFWKPKAASAPAKKAEKPSATQ
ncbi:MAG: hypothetical protein ACRD4S_02130 [Candidatus Acidiferrales bacterium]